LLMATIFICLFCTMLVRYMGMIPVGVEVAMVVPGIGIAISLRTSVDEQAPATLLVADRWAIGFIVGAVIIERIYTQCDIFDTVWWQYFCTVITYAVN
jgi:hypothetical protein